jgi:hypothetical protein
VATRLQASNALAKIIITRPLMILSSSMGGIVRHGAGAGVSEEDANIAMHRRWGGVSVVSTKFTFMKSY